MKGQKMSARQYKLRLMLVIVCLLIACVLVGGGLYFLFNGALEAQINQLGDFAVSSAVSQEERIRSECREVFDQITFDNELAALLYYQTPSAGSLLNGIKRLDSYRHSSAVIDSLYLYNVLNDTFYVSSDHSTQAVLRSGEMFDSQAVEIARRFREYDNMEPISRSLNVSYPKMALLDYVTYLRYNTLNGSNSTCVLFINVKHEVFLANLWQGQHEGEFRVDMIDKQGKTQIYQPEGERRADLSELPYIQYVLENDGKQGHFRAQVNGQSCFVFYNAAFSDYWSLCYSIGQQYINSLLDTRGKFFWLAGLLLALVLCVSAAGILIRRMIQFQNRQQQELEEAQEQKRSRAYQQRQQSRIRLLHESSKLSSEEMETLVEQCELREISQAPLTVVLFHQDDYQEFCTTTELSRQELIQYSLCALLLEITQEQGPLFSAETGQGNLALVVPGEKLSELIGRGIQQIFELMGLSFSAIIARPVERLSEVSEAFRWCEENSPYLQMHQRQCVLGWEEVGDAENTIVVYPDALARQMLRNVMQLDMQKAGKDLHEILLKMTEGSYKSYHVVLMQFLVALDESLTLLTCNNMADSEAYSSIALFAAASLEHVWEIESAICNLLADVDAAITSRKEEKYTELLHQIDQVVTEQAMNPYFGLNEIAEATSYSATYVGRLYRKMTGITLTERIARERMDRARRLLRETQLPINQVAEQSGFSDVTYFYKAFKKANGTTPNAYRMNKKEE